MTKSQEYTKPALVDHGSIADHTFRKHGPKRPKPPTPPGFSS